MLLCIFVLGIGKGKVVYNSWLYYTTSTMNIFDSKYGLKIVKIAIYFFHLSEFLHFEKSQMQIQPKYFKKMKKTI